MMNVRSENKTDPIITEVKIGLIRLPWRRSTFDMKPRRGTLHTHDDIIATMYLLDGNSSSCSSSSSSIRVVVVLVLVVVVVLANTELVISFAILD